MSVFLMTYLILQYIMDTLHQILVANILYSYIHYTYVRLSHDISNNTNISWTLYIKFLVANILYSYIHNTYVRLSHDISNNTKITGTLYIQFLVVELLYSFSCLYLFLLCQRLMLIFIIFVTFSLCIQLGNRK